MNNEDPRDLVVGALEGLPTFASSAELHDGYQSIYVDVPVLNFDAPDWEILAGKPGAGKTMAVKAWEEGIWAGVEAPRILPIYISARDTRGRPGADESPQQLAVAHFQIFLERLARELKRAAVELRRKQSVVERLLREPVARLKQKRIEQKLKDLLAAVETGRPLTGYDELIYEQELRRDREDRSSWGGRIQGGLSEVGARIGVGGGVSRSGSQSAQSSDVVYRRVPMGPRYAEVRQQVANLVEELEVDRICILLDDWSLIEPDVQPGFAELLARSLWGSPKITMKIVANRSEMQLIDPETGHGFQLGRDILEGTDLDHPQMSEMALVDFYEEVLFKRLSYLDDRLEMFVADRSGRPSREFLETVFESRQVFEVLVKGTEGITRTFLITIRRLAEGGVPEDGWSIADVQGFIGPADVPTADAFQDTDSFEQLTEAELTLEYVIRPVVVATESRLLLVRPEDKRKARVPMGQLGRRKIVEPVFADDLPQGFEAYDGYWLSDEQWRSFARAISYKRDPTVAGGGAADELEPREPVLASIEDARTYQLDFDRYRI